MTAEERQKSRVKELQKRIPAELHTLPAHHEDNPEKGQPRTGAQNGGLLVDWHPTPNGYFIAGLGGTYLAVGQTPEEAHDSLYEQYHGNKKLREQTFPHDDLIQEEAI